MKQCLLPRTLFRGKLGEGDAPSSYIGFPRNPTTTSSCIHYYSHDVESYQFRDPKASCYCTHTTLILCAQLSPQLASMRAVSVPSDQLVFP